MTPGAINTPPAPKISERAYQDLIVEAAHLFGWRAAHFRAAINARGHRMTPVAYDGEGYPDLTLLHPRLGVVWWEVKDARGQPSPAQRAWLEHLTAGGWEARVVRPRDWDYVIQTLRRGPA